MDVLLKIPRREKGLMRYMWLHQIPTPPTVYELQKKWGKEKIIKGKRVIVPIKKESVKRWLREYGLQLFVQDYYKNMPRIYGKRLTDEEKVLVVETRNISEFGLTESEIGEIVEKAMRESKKKAVLEKLSAEEWQKEFMSRAQELARKTVVDNEERSLLPRLDDYGKRVTRIYKRLALEGDVTFQVIYEVWFMNVHTGDVWSLLTRGTGKNIDLLSLDHRMTPAERVKRYEEHRINVEKQRIRETYSRFPSVVVAVNVLAIEFYLVVEK